MNRYLLIVLAACAAIAVSVALSAGAAFGSAPAVGGLPTVSVPTVSAPTVSVPTVSVPSVTVPSVTVGPISTPTVSTPSLTTPSVTTPSVPPIKTPTVRPPVSSRPILSTNQTSAAGAATSASGAPSVGNSSAAGGTPSSSRTSRGSSGRSRAFAATTPTASAKRTTIGTTGSSSPATVAATLAAASRAATKQGSHTSTTPAQPSKSSGPLERIVKELPTAALIALLAFGVIAAAMALNAYLQSRRAKSLAGQRAALLSDVGVLQAALLPTVPENLGDLGVSVAYRPSQGLAAGGDFFDVFTLAPERTGIIIGDVSGHGRESLIHAALVRYTLRALMGEGHPLPEVLARADRYLTGELGDGFATVIICSYEHRTAELTWAKAGHEPPIIAGQPDRDEAPATPLGFGMGNSWPQFSRVLAPGDRVCLFTDGLTEARRRGEHLGRAHLKSLVEQGLTAQALLERVEADSDVCTDDLAAVIIGRAPAPALVAAATPPQLEAGSSQPAAVS